MPGQLCSCLVVPWRKLRGTVEGRGKREQGLVCRLRRGGHCGWGAYHSLCSMSWRAYSSQHRFEEPELALAGLNQKHQLLKLYPEIMRTHTHPNLCFVTHSTHTTHLSGKVWLAINHCCFLVKKNTLKTALRSDSCAPVSPHTLQVFKWKCLSIMKNHKLLDRAAI